MSSIDLMERSFYNCLKEIERLYVVLPKHQRIKIEKWIEKLSFTSTNETWRKHRNAYLKLLLNMIITRNISEPFNTSPPDGPLPSFPFHLKVYTKNLLGPHESQFWRDLYNKLADTTMNNVTTDASLVDRSYQSNKLNSYSHDCGDNNYAIDTSNELSYNNISSSSAANKKNSVFDSSLSREIHNLNLLIKEQAKKIELLEQQLHDERLQHELLVQRINYSHRIEVLKLNEKVEVLLSKNESNNLLSTSNNNQSFSYSANNSHYNPNNGYNDTGIKSIVNSSKPRYDNNNSFSSANFLRASHPQHKSNFDFPYNSGENLSNLNVTVDTNASTMPATNTNVVNDPLYSSKAYDITPNTRLSSNSVYNSTEHLIPTTNQNYGNDKNENSARKQGNYNPPEDDFMKYIDNFQQELRFINESLPLDQSIGFSSNHRSY